jgi:hypothetical protein
LPQAGWGRASDASKGDGVAARRAAVSFVFLVTAGLDPAVHAEVQMMETLRSHVREPRRPMDCRIGPGNDD